MGVKGLWRELRNAEEELCIDDLRDSVLAIDANLWIIPRGLKSFFFRLRNLIKADITPVVIVDGNIHELKECTIRERRWKYAVYKKSGASLAMKRARFKEQNNRGDNTVAMKLCRSLGVPYYQSEGEADKLCAALSKKGIVDGVITEDSDVLIYGAQVVYRQFSTIRGSICKRYISTRISEDCGLNQYGLVAVAVLVGCDFLPNGVSQIGIKTALKLVYKAELGNMADLFSFLRKLCKNVSTKIIQKIVREYFSAPRYMCILETEFGRLDTELRAPKQSCFEKIGRLWKWNCMKCLVQLSPILLRWFLEGHNIPMEEIQISAKSVTPVGQFLRYNTHWPLQFKIQWEIKYKEVVVNVKTVETKNDLERTYMIIRYH